MSRRGHVLITKERLVEALGLPPCEISGVEWDRHLHALRVFVLSPDLPYDVPEGGVSPRVTWGPQWVDRA